MSEPIPQNIINQEFQKIKDLREVSLNDDIKLYLYKSQESFKTQPTLNPRGLWQTTLLHWAAAADCANIVQYLVKNGANVNIKDKNRRTPLFWAAENCAFQTVVILVQNGANVNAEDKNWGTPLSTVIEAGLTNALSKKEDCSKIIGYLEEMGAQYELKHSWWERTAWALGGNAKPMAVAPICHCVDFRVRRA
ncbi:ankyrin repeat domain-containing protein [Aspergillus tanneri]|uniref:Uncharacterized protein n=1 Tax=Aspergillus tanneri TaxID=1220188 RepID=A0A5M9M3U9_9EURO|nr:uncharacterized protein ATNIH1004_001893 [Aspergillus tanneri]KAA8641428.1 hypothetical protein ATNIH1004_001893 [Aspergillus tanneri]